MRIVNILSVIVSTTLLITLLLSNPSYGQSWVTYQNMTDRFTINIPPETEPTIEEITYPSEYDAVFPGRVYTVKKGDSAYFDSTMRHAMESIDGEDASVFWMCSSEHAVHKKLRKDS